MIYEHHIVAAKPCTKCNVVHPLPMFYRATNKISRNPLSGYKSHCKECVKDQRNKYYTTDAGFKYQIEKSWRDKGMEFTVEEYDKLLKEQNGGCAICGKNRNANGTRLCVDHNHDTGAIRGLLCHDCNTSIGKFNDDIEMLQKAIKYLQRYNQ